MTKSEIIEIIESAELVIINGELVRTEDMCIQPYSIMDLRNSSFWKYEDFENIWAM